MADVEYADNDIYHLGGIYVGYFISTEVENVLFEILEHNNEEGLTYTATLIDVRNEMLFISDHYEIHIDTVVAGIELYFTYGYAEEDVSEEDYMEQLIVVGFKQAPGLLGAIIEYIVPKLDGYIYGGLAEKGISLVVGLTSKEM